jgi:Fe2+ or Zn2+ uptake regulation protein
LADEGIVKIMDCVMQCSKSIKDIMMENNDISHTTAYRKIKWLLNEGLIVVDKIVITSDGKKFGLYHSTLKAINVRCEDNDVFVESEQNFDITKKRIENFFIRLIDR